MKDQNRHSQITKKKNAINQELVNKLKSKVKYRSNGSHPLKRIRIFYHDRNFKSCHFYNLELYHPKRSIHNYLYSEDHLPFISIIRKHCEGYANRLTSVDWFKNEIGTKGYLYKDYYSDDKGVGPSGCKRSRDRKSRYKQQQSNLSLRNCQSLSDILSKVFILDLFIL